ncbi:Phenoloxidase-activating factor 1-like [Homarus americanus]|uniref:Phenoloxidase-activating factor 1-like n=1 Tax=Homarus americanus TaxID=6706 RepID=A0A8J5KRF2_HOMAM|nr:Phenoloxidase-activating factor 1-like [Homarus americanus]
MNILFQVVVVNVLTRSHCLPKNGVTVENDVTVFLHRGDVTGALCWGRIPLLRDSAEQLGIHENESSIWDSVEVAQLDGFVILVIRPVGPAHDFNVSIPEVHLSQLRDSLNSSVVTEEIDEYTQTMSTSWDIIGPGYLDDVVPPLQVGSVGSGVSDILRHVASRSLPVKCGFYTLSPRNPLSIQTPRFPRPYPHNNRCTWKLQNTVNEQIFFFLRYYGRNGPTNDIFRDTSVKLFFKSNYKKSSLGFLCLLVDLLRARLGMLKRTTKNPEVTMTAVDIVLYPTYTFADDLALIKLSDAISITNTVRPICIPDITFKSESFQGKTLKVAGWGKTENGKLSDSLRKLERDGMDAAKCKLVFGSYITEHHFCTTGPGVKHICLGDSGGPVMMLKGQRFVLVGVISFVASLNCKGNYPDGHVSVAHFRDWIRKVTGY